MEYNKEEIISIFSQLDKSTSNLLLKINKLDYICFEDDSLLIKTNNKEQFKIILPDSIKANTSNELVDKVLKEGINKFIESKNKGHLKQLNTLVNSMTCNSGISIQLV